MFSRQIKCSKRTSIQLPSITEAICDVVDPDKNSLRNHPNLDQDLFSVEGISASEFSETASVQNNVLDMKKRGREFALSFPLKSFESQVQILQEDRIQNNLLPPIRVGCIAVPEETLSLATVDQIFKHCIPSSQDSDSVSIMPTFASNRQSVSSVKNFARSEHSYGQGVMSFSSTAVMDNGSSRTRQTSFTMQTEYLSCKDIPKFENTVLANAIHSNRFLMNKMNEFHKKLPVHGKCDLTSLSIVQSKLKFSNQNMEHAADCLAVELRGVQDSIQHEGRVSSSHLQYFTNSSVQTDGFPVNISDGCIQKGQDGAAKGDNTEHTSERQSLLESNLSKIFTAVEIQIEELEQTTEHIQSKLNMALSLNAYHFVHSHQLLLRNSMLQQREQQLLSQVAVLEDRLIKVSQLSTEISRSQNKIDEQRERQIISLRLQLACALANRVGSCPVPKANVENVKQSKEFGGADAGGRINTTSARAPKQ